MLAEITITPSSSLSRSPALLWHNHPLRVGHRPRVLGQARSMPLPDANSAAEATGGDFGCDDAEEVRTRRILLNLVTTKTPNQQPPWP